MITCCKACTRWLLPPAEEVLPHIVRQIWQGLSWLLLPAQGASRQRDVAHTHDVQAPGCHRLPVCMQVLDDVAYKKSMLEKLIWIW